MGCGSIRTFVNRGAKMCSFSELSHKLYPNHEKPEANPPSQKEIPFDKLNGKVKKRFKGTKIHQGNHTGKRQLPSKQAEK